ncbi:MAG: hypothetical protein V4666_06260 [Bacteroidota bacterium]
MAFDKRYVDSGILKIDGEKIKVYSIGGTYITINAGTDVRSANWAGNELIVHLANGKIRRYSYEGSYKTV